MRLPCMLSIICTQNGIVGGFEGEHVKLLYPQKVLPCVNTDLLVYCMLKSVQWRKHYVCGKILHTKKEK